MLQRFIKVEKDGSVSIQGDLKIMYSTMLKTRAQINAASKWTAHAALLIGLRYSCVRRQFRNISG
jgi:hypothetical protein